jgi:hypothetical protein
VAFTSTKSESKIKMDLCPVQPFELGGAQTCESAERPIGQRFVACAFKQPSELGRSENSDFDDLTFALCEMEQVPTEAWFPELPSNVEFEVYEQSMKLGSYNTVLTLLCIGEPA